MLQKIPNPVPEQTTFPSDFGSMTPKQLFTPDGGFPNLMPSSSPNGRALRVKATAVLANCRLAGACQTCRDGKF